MGLVIGLAILGAIMLAGGIYWAIRTRNNYGVGWPLLTAGGCITIVISAVCLFVWYSSSRQVELLNSKLGTSYTTEQMFWSGDIITETIEGNRIRLGGQGE